MNKFILVLFALATTAFATTAFATTAFAADADYVEHIWDVSDGCPETFDVDGNSVEFRADDVTEDCGDEGVFNLLGADSSETTRERMTLGLSLGLGATAFSSNRTDVNGAPRGAFGGIGELELTGVHATRPFSFGVSLGGLGAGSEEYGAGLTGRVHADWFSGMFGIEVGARGTQYGDKFAAEWTVRQLSFAPRFVFYTDFIEVGIEGFVGYEWQHERVDYVVRNSDHLLQATEIVPFDEAIFGGATLFVEIPLVWFGND